MASESTPKGVSSRLLTMKFMQRAAASGSSPGSSDRESPSSSSKKRKLDHSPAEGRIKLDVGRDAIQAAMDGQEATRQAALEKHASADSQWVLKSADSRKAAKPASSRLSVVYVGYGDINSSDEEETSGRTSTKRHKASDAQENKEDDEDDSSSDEDSLEHDDSPRQQSKENRSRSRSMSRQQAENAQAKAFRDKRKKKEVPLGKLLSISSGGAASNSSPKSMKCYNCNQDGHRASDCPNKGARGGRGRT